MEKKRYEIEIAGAQLAILSDEREEFIRTLVENLDSQIKEITVSSKRSSNLDAAILCALDYYSEKVKAEKRARNLEAQISLYDANLRRFREENIELRERLEAYEKNGFVKEEASAVEETIEDVETVEETVEEADAASALAEEQEEKSAPEATEENGGNDESRAARLRAIEELLGRQGKKD